MNIEGGYLFKHHKTRMSPWSDWSTARSNEGIWTHAGLNKSGVLFNRFLSCPNPTSFPSVRFVQPLELDAIRLNRTKEDRTRLDRTGPRLLYPRTEASWRLGSLTSLLFDPALPCSLWPMAAWPRPLCASPALKLSSWPLVDWRDLRLRMHVYSRQSSSQENVIGNWGIDTLSNIATLESLLVQCMV